jgi:polygalacturonase
MTDSTFNVMAYGAKGDGITDDTAAIQAALDAAGAVGGGQVYVPVGVFIVRTPLRIPARVGLVGMPHMAGPRREE